MNSLLFQNFKGGNLGVFIIDSHSRKIFSYKEFLSLYPELKHKDIKYISKATKNILKGN